MSSGAEYTHREARRVHAIEGAYLLTPFAMGVAWGLHEITDPRKGAPSPHPPVTFPASDTTFNAIQSVGGDSYSSVISGCTTILGILKASEWIAEEYDQEGRPKAANRVRRLGKVVAALATITHQAATEVKFGSNAQLIYDKWDLAAAGIGAVLGILGYQAGEKNKKIQQSTRLHGYATQSPD